MERKEVGRDRENDKRKEKRGKREKGSLRLREILRRLSNPMRVLWTL